MDDEEDYSYLDDSYYGDSGSGSGPYSTDTGVSDSGSVVNASAPVTTAAPDASGGNGSFLGVLQNTLTNGLSDAQLEATEYGLGSLNGLLTGNTDGEATPVAAPTTAVGTPNYLLWGLVVVGVIGIIYLVSK